MNELQVFTNPEFGQVRTVTIEEEPWFVGKDVAVALGYESPRAAVSKKVDPEDKGVSEMETPSGKQQMTIINESGLYALIFGSKLESAKRFKHWVTHEVLPAIRKTGSYSIIPKASDGTPTSPLANSLMAALPSDLRAVMQPVTKYTDNTGNASNSSGNVTTTTDYLFDLSEFEVFGTRSYANQYEQNYQAQYDYYKAGNTKIANNHTAVTTAVWWGLRSPLYNYGNNFVLVWTGGNGYIHYASYSGGLRPGFAA